MKKTIFPLLLSLLVLSSCAGSVSSGTVPPAKETPTIEETPSIEETPAPQETLTIAATTYPIYLFTTAVTEGIEGVEVKAVINQPMSCLHDYTLTVKDMKVLEGADVIALNGVGLEDFMSDALDASSALRIDCSTSVTLLPNVGHADHKHSEAEEAGTHYDPHIWMSPANAAIMLTNLSTGLAQADPGHAMAYQANAERAIVALSEWDATMMNWLNSKHSDQTLPHRELITFHDGFQYLAQRYNLTLLKSIEEEEGSEASAADIKEIMGLISDYELPVIFTEVNGSNATALAIQRETGVAVGELTMIMSGDGQGLDDYFSAMEDNARALVQGLSGGGMDIQ